MSKLLDAAVTKAEDGSWNVVCPITDGTCGGEQPVNPLEPEGEKEFRPFTSVGWPTKAIARDRLDVHIAEHKGEGEPVSLEEFRAKHGLVGTADGKRAVISVKDL